MSGPSYEVDRHGGIYSITLEPKVTWWWWFLRPRRARQRARQIAEWHEARATAEAVGAELFEALEDDATRWARRHERRLRIAAIRRARLAGEWP